MTGISEILVLILLICGLLIVPRMMKPAPKASAPKPKKPLSAGMRTGIVVSLVLPMTAAMVVRPWEGNILIFFSTGILPVALGWGLFWILSARRN